MCSWLRIHSHVMTFCNQNYVTDDSIRFQCLNLGYIYSCEVPLVWCVCTDTSSCHPQHNTHTWLSQRGSWPGCDGNMKSLESVAPREDSEDEPWCSNGEETEVWKKNTSYTWPRLWFWSLKQTCIHIRNTESHCCWLSLAYLSRYVCVCIDRVHELRSAERMWLLWHLQRCSVTLMWLRGKSIWFRLWREQG